VDVHAKVAQIRSLVEDARMLPMSSSCVLSRSELLEHLDELAQLLRSVVGDRTGVVEGGRRQAEQIIADAYLEQEKLASESEVYRVASRAAEELLTEARAEADALRRETDDYVDQRLASLELSLQKTLVAVSRGRSRLQGRSELEELRSDGAPLSNPFDA